MPRIAIKDYDTSFFHIMVQGIRKECGMTHKEIADELGVSRVKITRLISGK